MPVQKLTYRCLLISPSDVEKERDAIESVANHWNAQIGRGLEAAVEMVRWESHARPDMSGPPQDVINRQMVDDCDFGIAVFWSRLGSPTAKHPSGSVEEIERLIAKGANVMVYFSSAAVPQERLRDDQFSKLQEIRKNYQERGLLATYESVEALKTKVTLHLTSLVSSLLTKARAGNQPIPSTGTLTAPKPDIRLRIRAVLVGPRAGQMGAFVSVDVQNHSPMTFYFQSLSFAVSDGSGLMVTKDAYTGDLAMARPIQPGDSLTILVDPQDLSKHLGPGVTLTNVSVTDKIGRLFLGDVFELRDAVTQWQTNIQTVRNVHG
jgi:hypothetical protein